MSDDNVMRIYLKEYPDSLDEAVNIVVGDRRFRSTFMHEIAHHLNSVRSDREPWRASGLGDKTLAARALEKEEDKIPYARSTEEMQARMTQVFQSLTQLYTKGIQGWGKKNPAPGTENYFKSVDTNDSKLFMEQVLKDFELGLHLKKLNASSRRRIIKRILGMFEHFKKYADLEPTPRL